MSSPRRRVSDPTRSALLVLTGAFQAIAGALGAYVTYVLLPTFRESFIVAPVAVGQSVQMGLVPAGLTIAAFLLVRRGERPQFGPRWLGLLLAVSFVGYYLGYWGVGYFVPTPGGVLPIHGGFVAWILVEPSPYLPWAWAGFLKPAVDGFVATLAGVAIAMVIGD